MPLTGLDAYRTAQKTTTSPREYEAFLLFKAARQLEVVQNEWDRTPDLKTRLWEALRFNTRLWTVFQVSLTDPDHTMPDALRTNIIQLVRFIQKRTMETLAKPAPEQLRALIEINRQVAAGLSTIPAPSQAAA